VSGAVNRNGRRNGSDCHSVGIGYEIENEGVADGGDHYLSSHSHDVGGGKDGSHRGKGDKWVLVARNSVSE